MLAIAILSLISWFTIIIFDYLSNEYLTKPIPILSSIVIISWWDICLPVSIIFIILGFILILSFLIAAADEKL